MNYDLKVDILLDIYYNKGILLMVNNQSDERRHVVDQVFGHVDHLEACIKYDTVHCIGLIHLFFPPQKIFWKHIW